MTTAPTSLSGWVLAQALSAPMITLWVGMAVTAGSAITALVLGRLQRSGKIATSEAAVLWEKTNKIESDLHAQLTLANARIERLEAANEALHQERLALHDEHTSLRIEHAQCESRLAILEATVRASRPPMTTVTTVSEAVTP